MRTHIEVPVASLPRVVERTSEAMLARAAGEVDLATVPIFWSNLKAIWQGR